MDAPPSPVTHISDTALWVAALRARESARPDAVFRDPLAEKLGGERGHRIAAQLSTGGRDGWPIVVRTKLIDDLVRTSIEEGADRVINLAAGLDTRPYRLPVPSTLTWIEADLPDLVAEKERLLAGEQPACRVVREKVDLADAAARAAFLDGALAGARRALAITEGLLVYLEPEQVSAIARDLRARDAVAWWLIDLASPRVLQMIRRQIGSRLDAAAPMKFAPAEGVAFFRPLGWRARDVRSYFREAVRLRRVPAWMRLFAWFPDPDPERVGRRPWGAAVRFERG
jgi:methyltransferase (TIGR00027 family)